MTHTIRSIGQRSRHGLPVIRVSAVAGSALLAIAIAGCDSSQTSSNDQAQEVIEELQEAGGEVGDELQEAGDEIRRELTPEDDLSAADRIEEELDDAADAAKKAAADAKEATGKALEQLGEAASETGRKLQGDGDAE